MVYLHSPMKAFKVQCKNKESTFRHKFYLFTGLVMHGLSIKNIRLTLNYSFRGKWYFGSDL